MKTSALRLALLAGLLTAPFASAQNTTTQAGATTVSPAQPAAKAPPAQPLKAEPQPLPPPAMSPNAKPQGQVDMVQPAQPGPTAILPPFDRLAKLGPDGKIVRVDGILDILAIPRNKLIDDAAREKCRPVVKAWMADVDQLAIDNLDFLEKIEPSDGSAGVIDTLDISDMARVRYVAQMMTQLMSAGPLSAHLEQKEVLNRDQSNLNQQIVSDYLQQVMNEIMAEGGTPNDITKKPQNEEEKVKQVNNVSRFLYHISCRDAVDSFHRQLADAAPIMDKVVAKMELSADQKAKLQAPLASCKSAKTVAEKRKASRAVLDQLSFDQKREAMNRAHEMAPSYDPLAGLPPQPVAEAPAAPSAPMLQPVGARTAPTAGGK